MGKAPSWATAVSRTEKARSMTCWSRLRRSVVPSTLHIGKRTDGRLPSTPQLVAREREAFDLDLDLDLEKFGVFKQMLKRLVIWIDTWFHPSASSAPFGSTSCRPFSKIRGSRSPSAIRMPSNPTLATASASTSSKRHRLPISGSARDIASCRAASTSAHGNADTALRARLGSLKAVKQASARA